LPAGYASGGGDTGLDKQPQRLDLTMVLTGSTTKSFVLPKGTVIIAGVSIPFPPANGDDSDHAVASAGTVSVGLTDGGTEFLSAATASHYTRTAYANGYVLTADTRIYCACASAITGYVKAGVEAYLPLARS
jgi:hypothetical protein